MSARNTPRISEKSNDVVMHFLVKVPDEPEWVLCGKKPWTCWATYYEECGAVNCPECLKLMKKNGYRN